MSPHPEPGKRHAGVERPQHCRLPVSAPVEWILKGRQGRAFTSDIDSGGEFGSAVSILRYGYKLRLETAEHMAMAG